MVNTRARTTNSTSAKNMKKVYYESDDESVQSTNEENWSPTQDCVQYESEVSDNESVSSESSHSTSSTQSSSSSDMSSDSESEYSESDSEYSECEHESDSDDDPDYEYESPPESDDDYEDEFEELNKLHDQLVRWKNEHGITYDDVLAMHSLLMLKWMR